MLATEPRLDRDPDANLDPPSRQVSDSATDKSSRKIRDMFAGVAPRYDLLNHLLSAFLDVVWRRRAAAVLTAQDRERVLDLCCGTGDQATALHRRGARVVAADFCVPMLAIARRKFMRPGSGSGQGSGEGAGPAAPRASAADALHLPFRPGFFSAATVSFGMRNVADLDAALQELAATLRPGARVVILEFAVPRPRPLRAAYLFYFRRVLPWIGRLISDRGSAYTYLPESVLAFPQREGFLERMAAAGCTDLSFRDFTAGIVCLYSGRTAG